MEILESEKNSLELLEARLTESKLAEYIQLGVRRSDLSFLESIWSCSNHLTEKSKTSIFSIRHNNTVPLVLAAQVGNLVVFDFLVDHGCDIEAKGNCEFDNETIIDVPPLWVAAAAGKISVVARLLELRANVNSTTSTNSTPLRAACYDGHIDIVSLLLENSADINMSNRHGHTPLMIAAFRNHLHVVKLLLTRPDVNINAASLKGNTAMHDAAEAGNLEILQELLTKGASIEVDSDGVSPLRLAALHGMDNIIQYFGSGKFIDHAKPEIAFKIEKVDIVESIELMGCWYVDRKKDLTKAIRSWSWASFLRYPEKEDRKRIEKKEISPRKELNFQKEANSPTEINELLADINKLRLNSLLIRERILGPKNPQTIHYIRYRGAIYADSGDFQKCLDLWNYGLHLQLENLPILSPNISLSFLSFVDFFVYCQTKQITNINELNKFFNLLNHHIK
jgi:ankyrin repeat protein